MFKELLHENWTLRAVGKPDEVPEGIPGRDIPAFVPGCVHTDLLAAGLIEDPYLDRNELKVQWIGRNDWEYACAFEAPLALFDHDRVDLVCEGLDTVAALRRNDKPLGETANMHHPHRFDVKDVLGGRDNRLSVTFASADRYVEQELARLKRPEEDQPPHYNVIRKMACNFGWDWGPKLTTAGIWRPIYLQGWSAARVARVRPLVTRADADEAAIEIHVDVQRAATADLQLSARLTAPDAETIEQTVTLPGKTTKATVTLTVPNPRLWWPRGHGRQDLYELNVQVRLPGRAGALDEWTGRIGLRTVELDTTADEIGSRFAIKVNGKDIFCKGANWIPDDCFPTRIDPARYRRRIDQAVEANMNMLRVWGGGIYEADAFYRACDELGVMVWQDFMFACSAYPEESPLRDRVEAEARHQIARLSAHPSVVLWNGSNENIWFAFMKDWDKEFAGRTWGAGYYLELLPALVKEVNPVCPYWPSSPYSGSMEIDPLDDRHGSKHVWDVWNRADYTVYRDYSPRFAPEFGFQAPPAYPTLRRAIPDDQLAWDSPAMVLHQKRPGGQEANLARLGEHFEIPDDFDDLLYLTQLNQARAIACGVEWWRSRRPVCMGTLYWQLNDCWPVNSWSAIDGDGRPKPLWFASRRFFADRLLTIQPDNGRLALFADNDTDRPWQDEVRVTRMSFQGKPLAAERFRLDAPARRCVRVADLGGDLARPAEPSAELIVADGDGARGLWFFDIDKKLDYPRPAFKAELTGGSSTHWLRIQARSLLVDAAVFADRLDPNATVNDQLVTLLPGESFTFVIESQRRLERDALIAPPVFQCANRFGRRGPAGNATAAAT